MRALSFSRRGGLPQRLPQSSVRQDAFSFSGGIDLVTAPLSVPPGRLRECVNYFPDMNGGYRRVDGYERFDGRPRPSDAEPQAIACTVLDTALISAGDTLTIGAVTAAFVKAVPGGMLVLDASGTIPASTAIFKGATPVGTTNSPAALSYAPTAQEEAENLRDAAAIRRAVIAAVPGEGPVRGVVMFGATVYAWRNNAGGTACVMHRSTAAGWQPVVLAEEVDFSNANSSVGAGDTLTQGAVTATVARVIVETGTLASGTNTGRLVITGRSGGNFSSGAASSTGGGALTLSGAQTAQSFPPGGKYRFDQHNFAGNAESYRLYGVNGVGPAFEFDGTTLAFIRTGSSPDTPSHVRAHRGYLVLAQKASVLNSSVGDPQRWVASEGASEKAVGDDVTNLFLLPGEALGITTRNRSYVLLGAGPATWSLQTLVLDRGALADTAQSLLQSYALDDRGVIRVDASQNYGNFAGNTVSQQIQPLINGSQAKPVASCVVRARNLYQLFFDDRRVLVGLPVRGGMAFGLLELAHQAQCVWSGEDQSGAERIFFGATDGRVYEMGRGGSFDGAAIEAAFRLHYVNSRSPQVVKRYLSAAVQMSAALYAAIRVAAELSYGAPDTATPPTEMISVAGIGGIWNLSNWDEFFWDSQDVYEPRIRIDASGVNIAMTFFSESDADPGHVISGVVLSFIPRRLRP